MTMNIWKTLRSTCNAFVTGHTLLWFVLNDGKLSRAVDAIISDPTNEVFVSPATFWELAIKVRTKKLDLLSPYDDFIRNGIVGNDFIVLPIEAKHTSLLTDMPFHHKDPFDRIRESNVQFKTAGENLALAPTLSIAHNGLMNSPGHRANILRPQFGRVGIGVLDSRRHGLMITQNFRN